MKNLKKFLFLALCTPLLFSCGKSDDAPNNGKGKNIRITVSAPGLNKAQADDVLFVIAGGSVDANVKTFWKVNGVVRTNESTLSLTEVDFTGAGQSAIIESVVPVEFTSVGFSATNFDSAFKVNYKAEVDGKVVNEEKDVIVTNDYSKQFSY